MAITDWLKSLRARKVEEKKSDWQEAADMVDAMAGGKTITDDFVLSTLDAAGLDLDWLENRVKMVARRNELIPQRAHHQAEADKLPGLEIERAKVQAEWDESTRRFKHRLEQISIGIDDAYSGVDAASLQVTLDVPVAGVAAGDNLASKFNETSPGVLAWKLPADSALKGGQLTVSVKDRQGNESKIVRRFSTVKKVAQK